MEWKIKLEIRNGLQIKWWDNNKKVQNRVKNRWKYKYEYNLNNNWLMMKSYWIDGVSYNFDGWIKIGTQYVWIVDR